MLILLLAIAAIAILLNLITFLAAYPSSLITVGGKARDFSAYYIGAWRLIHNPQNVYYHGNVTNSLPGDYPIYPQPTAFKYLPFFLLFMLPLLSLSYQAALTFFNVLQFLLLPLMGWLVYKALSWRKKNKIIVAVVLIIALIEPFTFPLSAFRFYRFHEIREFLRSGSLVVLGDGISNPYYWQWVDGESKVLQTFLIMFSVYLATRKSWFSGVIFSLSSFDPRFTLLALPIVLMYNFYSKNVKKFTISSILTILISNLPLMLYAGIGQQFLTRAFASEPLVFYAYEWIPFYTILALTFANYDMFWKTLRVVVSRLRSLRSGSSFLPSTRFLSDRNKSLSKA